MKTQHQRVDERELRAAWDSRADLHAEFGTFETFAAFEHAVARGLTSLPSALGQAAQPKRGASVACARRSPVAEQVLRAAWDTRPELRAEFGNWSQLLAYEQACGRESSRDRSVLLDRTNGSETTETASTATNRRNEAGLERERQTVAVPLSSAAASAVNPRGASLAEVALSLRAPVHKLPTEKAEQVLAAVGLQACSREDGELWFDRATLDATARQQDVRSRITTAALQHVRKLGFFDGGKVAFA